MSLPSRTAALRIFLIIFAWLAIEGLAFFALRMTNHRWFSYENASQTLAEAANDSSGTAVPGLADLHMGDFVEVLHPYFGFVADPVQNKPEWKVSEYGFPFGAGASPVVKREPNKVIVGVFGGSFTQWVYLELKSLLETRGRETGKEFVVFNFGIGGHKQPQQLMILNYLLALGGEFDVVINLDGFNEVALPASENVPNQVNPYYPRGWDRRTAGAMNAPLLRLIGLREETKRSKTAWARSFRDRRFYWSPALFLIWQARDRSFDRTVYSLNREIQTETAKSVSYTQHGPKYDNATPDQLYRDLAAVWKRGSLQMKNLCQANGIRYFHFLQPNQYLPGSKPIGAEEAQKAVNPSSPYKPHVERGYPELVRGIAELRDQGVAAFDLTQIYSDHPELLYIDDCCHTNNQGAQIVAKRILNEAFLK